MAPVWRKGVGGVLPGGLPTRPRRRRRDGRLRLSTYTFGGAYADRTRSRTEEHSGGRNVDSGRNLRGSHLGPRDVGADEHTLHGQLRGREHERLVEVRRQLVGRDRRDEGPEAIFNQR